MTIRSEIAEKKQGKYIFKMGSDIFCCEEHEYFFYENLYKASKSKKKVSLSCTKLNNNFRRKQMCKKRTDLNKAKMKTIGKEGVTYIDNKYSSSDKGLIEIELFQVLERIILICNDSKIDLVDMNLQSNLKAMRRNHCSMPIMIRYNDYNKYEIDYCAKNKYIQNLLKDLDFHVNINSVRSSKLLQKSNIVVLDLDLSGELMMNVTCIENEKILNDDLTMNKNNDNTIKVIQKKALSERDVNVAPLGDSNRCSKVKENILNVVANNKVNTSNRENESRDTDTVCPLTELAELAADTIPTCDDVILNQGDKVVTCKRISNLSHGTNIRERLEIGRNCGNKSKWNRKKEDGEMSFLSNQDLFLTKNEENVFYDEDGKRVDINSLCGGSLKEGNDHPVNFWNVNNLSNREPPFTNRDRNGLPLHDFQTCKKSYLSLYNHFDYFHLNGNVQSRSFFVYPVLSATVHELMRYEILRIKSFNHSMSLPAHSVTTLAQAGFYFSGIDQSKSNGEITCFSCGQTCPNFLAGVDLNNAHKPLCQRSSNIPISEGTSGLTASDFECFNSVFSSSKKSSLNFNSTDNVSKGLPSKLAKCHAESLPSHHQVYHVYTSATHDVPIECRPDDNTLERKQDFLDLREASYPQFASRRSRHDTFQSWDPNHRQRPDDLVDLGFFFAGYSDCARCFYCGLGLKYWRPEDDAAYQHARFRPQCVYNKFVMGQNYIDSVQASIASGTDVLRPESAGAGSAQAGASTEAMLVTNPIVLRVLQDGWDRTRVLRVAASLVNNIGKECLVYDILHDALVSDQVSQRSGDVTGSVQGATNTHDASVDQSGEIKLNKTDSTSLPAEAISTKPNLNADNESTNLSSDVVFRLLEREHSYLTKRLNCRVCGKEKVACIYLPCGHVCACVSCGDLATNCLICDKLISAFANIYMS